MSKLCSEASCSSPSLVLCGLVGSDDEHIDIAFSNASWDDGGSEVALGTPL